MAAAIAVAKRVVIVVAVVVAGSCAVAVDYIGQCDCCQNAIATMRAPRAIAEWKGIGYKSRKLFQYCTYFRARA